jgi:TP53 regulating kinase-like protein
LLKQRISKGYRVKRLDAKIRGQRTKREAKLLRAAARAGVAVPRVLKAERFELQIDFIAGQRIKELLNKSNYKELAAKIGTSVAKLHDHDIVHGDLTTSNMILRNEKIHFIDFGLGFFSRSIEDKATDLHLLLEALNSTHYEIAKETFAAVLNQYKKS